MSSIPWLETKTCKKCNEGKPTSDFRVRLLASGPWVNTICKTCENQENKRWRVQTNRDRKKVLWQYNLTLEGYDKLLSFQDGLCALCGESPEEGEYLQVDHDHACCEVRPTCGKCTRGLLCHRCNKGLGMFRDSANLLLAAAFYINERGIE